MLRNWKWAALPLLGLGPTSAAGYDQIVLKRGWDRVDFAENGPCQAEIGTNGQFYVIAIYGMLPDEQARFTLSSGDMLPIARNVTADDEGVWKDYYIPFRWGRSGGSVLAQLSSESCDVALSFDWKRKQP